VNGNPGGGGGSRTHDAADMSRADSELNLLELLTELLLEAGVGGSETPPKPGIEPALLINSHSL
jgi:hypothetical protein